MFGFLNSTVLIAAAAALIPLLIHLFSRRRVRVVEFSSLKHLKQMEKRQLRRLKIRQWLLLIARMLIVLMAVLAFARPTVREGSVGAHASVAAVVLFDNSASMDRSVADGNLLELARQRTAQLLETFSQSDKVALVTLDKSGGAGFLEMASPAVAVEELTRVRRGAAKADLQSGMQTAIDLLQSATSLNRELYLVGDRQRTSLPELDLLHDQAFPLYQVDIPLEDVDNLGIVAVDFGGQLIHPGHDFDLVATIRNYSPRDSDERIASLYLDGRRVAQTDFEVPSGGETTVRFTRSVAGTGFHSGYVELTDDRFAPDNRYYFSFRIPEQSSVLIIDGDPVTSLLSLALVPDASGAQYWSVKVAGPGHLAGVNFLDYSVIVAAGMPRLDEAHLRRLQAYVRRGGALFLTYGGNTDIDYFNAAWSEITGINYKSPVRHSFSRAGFYTFDRIEFTHPVFLPFHLEQGRPPEIKFFTLPQLEVVSRAKTLVSFTGEAAALVESQAGDGRVMTFTGPMSPEFSDLTSHGFFVPFVSRVIEYLASDLTSLEIKLFAGQSLTRSLPPGEAAGLGVDLILPDSSAVRLALEDSEGASEVRINQASQAGVYRMVNRGREIDRFAVNIDPIECDLASVDHDQLAQSLGAGVSRRLNYGAPLAEALARFRVGRELWPLFLWAAAMLLAAEMLLGRRSPEE
ncbi:MAG: BatA domain-containing protein [Candidatus Zixiibacteriota bacterium]